MIPNGVVYRELHLLLDGEAVEHFVNGGNSVCTTCVDTEDAVRSQTPLIFTTITHFLSWSFATRLFVHVNGEEHELIIGDCKGTERRFARVIIWRSYSFQGSSIGGVTK